MYSDAKITKNVLEVGGEQVEAWRQEGNPKYWVAGETYNFAAYAPAEVGTPNKVEEGDVHLNFTGVTANAATQNDFIYAIANKGPIVENQNPGSVALNFGHMLSMAKVTIKSGFTADYQITITNLTIKGMYSQANFAGDGGVWSDWSNPDATGFVTSNVVANSTTPAVSGEYIVLPQTLGIEGAENVVKVSFHAEVTAINAPDDLIGSHDFEGTLTGTWDKGNRYNYVVTLDKGNFTGGEDPEQDIFEITFDDPSVTPWKDSEQGDQEITVE